MKKQRAKPGEILSDILSLVGFNIPREEIMTWTKSQRKSAEKWAALCHLKASDNPVKVPKMPEHLEKYPIT